MEMKIQKEFIDTGFGFPVKLLNVPMVKVRGHWTPKINYNGFADAVLFELAQQPSRLTGSEVKFIRHRFEMTLQEFGKRFDVSHVAVLKWEKAGHKPTAMSWPAEKDLRLFILDQLRKKPQDLAKLYRELTNLPSDAHTSIRVDASGIAA